jgi:uncharacterized repeat protein (TIGR01451 family)
VRICAAVLAVALGAAITPNLGLAATAEGALLTNVACATLSSAERTPWEVSYCATAKVLVVVPSIQLTKRATPSMECSGATVTFCIYAINTSPYTSAFNISLDDVLSSMMVYVSGQDVWNGTTAGTTVTKGRGRNDFLVTYDWTSEPGNGQVAPYNVRWLINWLGPNKSAMMCFKMRIL